MRTVDATSRKVLVFMLARRGCIAYANEMVNLLPGSEIKIYASRYCEEPLPEHSLLLPTFKNIFQFFIRTGWTLPNFIWKIHSDFRKGYQIFYFPVFHHWNPVLLLLAKWLGAKTIVTVHDAVFHPGEWQLGQGTFQRLGLPSADRLVVLSDFVKQQLPTSWHRKTHVIPHPLLLNTLPVQPRTLPRLPRLLFLGRIAYYKGVDLLLEAVKTLPASSIQHLTIAGMAMQETPLPDLPFPIQKIERWLSEAELMNLLTSHDILVLPYREASQSGVVTLGIAAGIPMIVTKVGGLTEQLADNEAVWVEPTVESICTGIIQLIENADLYQNLHQNLLLKRRQNRTPVIQQQLTALLDELTSIEP